MSRRRVLDHLAAWGSTHAGQAWLRLLDGFDDDQTHLHVSRVAGMSAPQVYSSAFSRWDAAMGSIGAVRYDGECLGPVLVGAGNLSPLEVGITLHHTYGVPSIPGSAVKGLCRRAAADVSLPNDQRLSAEQLKVLFGSDDDANPERGYVTYWGAWMLPTGRPFQADVLTPHHSDYYGRKSDATGHQSWPTPSDDPVPVPFLTVRQGSRFRFALSAPDSPEYLHLAAAILRHGLRACGIGAKTNAGYGRIRLGEGVSATA